MYTDKTELINRPIGDIFGVDDVPYLIDTTSRLSELLETITKDLSSAAEAGATRPLLPTPHMLTTFSSLREQVTYGKRTARPLCRSLFLLFSHRHYDPVLLHPNQRFAMESSQLILDHVIGIEYQRSGCCICGHSQEGRQVRISPFPFGSLLVASLLREELLLILFVYERKRRYHGIALSLVHFWGEQPPVLTYWSVACFVVGLVTFTWASHQVGLYFPGKIYFIDTHTFLSTKNRVTV